MNREQIIAMADKADVEITNGDGWPNERFIKKLERFAALVAAAEREECAKVCEGFNDGLSLTAIELAAAIRARGAK